MDYQTLIAALQAAQAREANAREELKRSQSALNKAECATTNARNALGKAIADAGLLKGACDWTLSIRPTPASGESK